MEKSKSTYSKYTVNSLKIELMNRGAVTTGRKEDLIQRLQAYDRNQDFKGVPVFLPEPEIPDWPVTGFHQLLVQHRVLFPKLSKGQIEGYFKFRMACDKDEMNDLKALEKGQSMLVSLKIDACSVHMTRDNLYLTGIVKAAMKRKLSYNYKIRLHGQTAEILNSHCECPAGKGSHSTCKHIAAVLLMIEHFLAVGSLLIRTTCTENLQTFHVPQKTFIDSPVKADSIPGKRKRTTLDDDPRPRKYRNVPGYQDNVRSLVLNFCANRSQDISMRYLYARADLQAAVVDHDYFDVPFTQYWISASLNVSTEKAQLIENLTRGQSKCNLWFDERQWRITASTFGNVCKATVRRNKTKLCRSMVQPKMLI